MLNQFHDDYFVYDGYLMKGGQLFLPRTSILEKVIRDLYGGRLAGHLGKDKTIEAVKSRYYWPKLKRDMTHIISRCQVPNHALDLINLPKVSDLSVAAGNLAEQGQSVQEDVKKMLEIANAKYKEAVDRHRRFKVFEVGDEVMFFMSKARIVGEHYKLKQRKYCPFKITKKINDNAYAVDLPYWMGNISKTFNVAYLYSYLPDCALEYSDTSSSMSLFSSGGE
ncbi:hypothetical protein GH714_011558 [Hevea brasiliensis]|uniref:Uncharacterized protein n=1 Tax=Hevea brasiliensis TaxID=3981 RepID=A0A6A6M5R8_HEVBR|nr:hypothetical protein GH714_011558 [Hevea brasiliensis]